MSEIKEKELLVELNKLIQINYKRSKQSEILLKELETVDNQIIEYDKVKSQFLSNIRNEINNPLTAILGMSANLANRSIEKEEVHKTSNLIYQEAFDLNFQLKNIFIAAELQAGELIPEIVNARIPELIAQITKKFQHKTDKKKLTITLTNKLESDTFRTDSEKIYLMLSNLLANAIENSELKGNINFEIKIVQGELAIIVQYFGIGIKLDDSTNIYDRFKQLEEGSIKGFGGYVGLSIIKELLELLGGKISVESEVMVGSTFTLFIPEGIAQEDLNAQFGANEFLFE
mgnify:FL=1|tara:strand:- start:4461 stop:5324 length:864 start_codon:yes stop_codon:yes gene_type:complete